MNSNNTIPKGWYKTTLGEVAGIRRGASPRPIHDFLSRKSGLPWIKISDVSSLNSRHLSETREYIKREGESATVIVNEGDLILSNSATPGIPKFVNIRAGIHDGWLLLNENNIDKLFLYYLLVYSRPNLVQVADGAVFKNLKIDLVKEHMIVIPEDKAEQKATAAVLSSLDDKIELLREENKTLETIAQAIFKEWFVNFNFPGSTGKMIDSELGKIPEGWRVGKFSDYVNKLVPGEWGQDIQDESHSSKVICLRGTDLTDIKYGSSLRAPIRFINEGKLSKVVLKSGDLIVEISGGTIGQSTGRIAYYNSEISNRLGMNVVTSNFCKIIRLKEIEYQSFVFYYWEYLYKTGLFFNFENGTTGIQNLNLKAFLEEDLVMPSNDVCKKFCIFANDFLATIQSNNSQLMDISSLRDNLIPKLIRGDIKVNHHKQI